jgi:hypothetical protein
VKKGTEKDRDLGGFFFFMKSNLFIGIQFEWTSLNFLNTFPFCEIKESLQFHNVHIISL